MTWLKRNLKIILSIILISIIAFAIWLFNGKAPGQEEIEWGLSFSQKQAEMIGVSWRDNYVALLDELSIKNLKLIAYWDLIESEPGNYYFDDMDFQIEEAKNREAKVIFTLGRKVPRWPECHVPDWAVDMDIENQNDKLLEYIEKVVLKYRDSDVIWAWQVENEPFFEFGNCPKLDEDLLKKEIELVRSLDYKNRPVIISDSGSYRFWFKAASFGDKVSISLYRKAWYDELDDYVEYPLPPVFYYRKNQLVDLFYDKEVFCGELQAEPWGPVLIHELPLIEQEKTMNISRFKETIDFAKNTGFNRFYLWGGEWWYWMKEKHDKPELWNEAEKIFER